MNTLAEKPEPLNDDVNVAEEESNQQAESEIDNEDDEIVIQVGDEETPASEDEDDNAPDFVKRHRAKLEEQAKQIREERKALRLEREQIEQSKQTNLTIADSLPPKPTLESCDFDSDELSTKLEAWTLKKIDHDKKLTEIENEAKNQQLEFKAKVDTYNEAKSKLKVSNFVDLEEDTVRHLSVMQQGILIQGAKNPAILVAALGANNGKLAEELAKIKDPVKFAFAAAELETKLKVTSRKAPPAETSIKSGTPMSATQDLHLKKLEAEAERTGDRTKVQQYKRSLKK